MPNSKLIKKYLALVILMTVTLAPFLDSVACADCHSSLPQGGPSNNHLTITNSSTTASLHDFPVYETTSSGKPAPKDNSPCPFCVFNIFAVTNTFHPEILFPSTPFLNPKVSLAPIEPVFLKNKPPIS